ncbi:SURF-family protein [Geopyxis carbonaria]|nr:SURF-family protein [Geopyxis carbonaria]
MNALRPLRLFSRPFAGCLRRPAPNPAARRFASSPADQPEFQSILDQPAQLVRSGKKKHGPGLLVLIAIPVTAFAMGTWQVQRLEWKTALVARYEDRLLRPPLPLPPAIDTTHLGDFDYRRVLATGRFRHDQEMLLGPRIHEGENGFTVVTPLEREGGSTVLVARGWINKKKMRQEDRRDELPEGEVTVEGLLRSPWKKNFFTPPNAPEKGEFYFPDVAQMAGLVGAQPVWIEATQEPDLVVAMESEAKGRPIGRPAEVNLRNNHLQYIVTWYGLSAATTFMLFLLLRKPPSGIRRQVRHSKEWS